jgi:hypothetical protein
MTLRRRCKITAAVANELSPSLRANGSRECAPDDRLREAIQRHKESLDCFVASLLAMTEPAMLTRLSIIQLGRRYGVNTARPTSLPCCNSTSAWFALANGIGVTGIGAMCLLRTSSSSSAVSRKLPT